MKSYTDIEQSKKLAEILPLESADMSWVSNGLGKPFARTIPIKGDPEELCGCWTLAALLNALSVSLNILRDGKWNAGTPCDGETIYEVKDNPIDACYELILKLYEQKLL